MLSADAVVDAALVQRVIEQGHSRVPVHAANNKQVWGEPVGGPGCWSTGIPGPPSDAAAHACLPATAPRVAAPQHVLGLLLTKELGLVDTSGGAGAATRVGDLRLRDVPCMRGDMPLYDALRIFRMGRSHMALVAPPLDKPGADCSDCDALGKGVADGSSKGLEPDGKGDPTAPAEPGW